MATRPAPTRPPITRPTPTRTVAATATKTTASRPLPSSKPRSANAIPSTARKTDLSTVEALVVEGTLGEEARRSAHDGTMARIQQLTQERQKLYRDSAAHPLLASRNGPRIREVGAEIEMLWEVLRRERATRRVQIERALQVVDEDDDDDHAPVTVPQPQGSSIDAA